MVSVVIPTYNRAWCLEKAVASVLSQSFDDLEVVIIDDGSQDDSGRMVERLQQSYPGRELVYRLIQHGGVSRARNRGIGIARGTWVAFLDSDDYWMPEKLERQLSYLHHHTDYPICHTDELWIRNGTRINQGRKYQKSAGWFFIQSLQRCMISPSSALIHRSLFDEVGLFDETFPYVEDYDLWLRITSRYPVGYVDEKLVVKTGGHADQLSKQIDGIEKYRIAAIEKVLRSGELSGEFFREALRVYRHKAHIYLNGCLKRGRAAEARRVSRRLEYYARMGS
jgi:glycosyltransferase involved in cell wall biosynthesis